MKKNTKLMRERHAKMIEYQERIKPFTPTMDDLCDVFSVSQRSTVRYTIKNLEKMGLVITRIISKNKKQYYAIQKD